MLDGFKDDKICVHISYHILDFIQQKETKFTMEQPYMLPILSCQYHACWYPGDLTHWGRVTHICVNKLTIIGSDIGLSPGRRQAIIWTNDRILLIGPLGTKFSEILSGIQTFSFKKIHLNMSFAKWRLFCLGLNVLRSQGISRHCIDQISQNIPSLASEELIPSHNKHFKWNQWDVLLSINQPDIFYICFYNKHIALV